MSENGDFVPYMQPKIDAPKIIY